MSRISSALCSLLVAVAVLGVCERAHAQDGPVVSQNLNGDITLRELLEKDLRAQRDVELLFIQRVVKRVEEKKIPLDTVMTMYRWSKKKSHRPYQYFEKGMKVQAERLGVDLLARTEEDPKGGLANFFRSLRIRFARLSVRL